MSSSEIFSVIFLGPGGPPVTETAERETMNKGTLPDEAGFQLNSFISPKLPYAAGNNIKHPPPFYRGN